MDIDTLTKRILQQALSPTPAQFQSLRDEILATPEYFLIAAPETTREEWERKQFAVYIDAKKALAVFLTQEEAEDFAKWQDCILPSRQSPVIHSDNNTLAKLAAEYAGNGLIDSIKIYAHSPVSLTLSPRDFIREPRESSSTPTTTQAQPQSFRNTEPPVTPPVVQAPPQSFKGAESVAPSTAQTPLQAFQGVEDVKKAFETYEAVSRRKLDPGARYENIHTLVQSLTQQNGIDPAKMDSSLGLPEGYTRQFCNNIKDANPSIEILVKYLSYFGLREYLFLFSADCRDLMAYLKQHKDIDKYKLKTPPSAEAERFKIESVERGKDRTYGAYVYKVTLNSAKGNQITLVVSNPLKPPLSERREYQIMDKNGNPRDEDAKPAKITEKAELPSEDAMRQLVEELEEKQGGSKRTKQTPNKEKNARSYEETRKDEIIRYFRTLGMNGPSAEARYKDLEIEADILDEFYKYTKKKQTGGIEVQGYTARKLIKELHLSPYDAYLALVQLRSDPKNTKQRLIYLERDPQYQKPKQQKEGE